jgi:hypothetical protein
MKTVCQKHQQAYEIAQGCPYCPTVAELKGSQPNVPKEFTPKAPWGLFCGMPSIDQVIGGLKKGEVWLHASPEGDFNSAFALNWACNLVTRYRKNVLYASYQDDWITLGDQKRPKNEVYKKMAVLHSTSQDFVIFAKNKGIDPSWVQPLNVNDPFSWTTLLKIDTFRSFVYSDFAVNRTYGDFHTLEYCDSLDLEEILEEPVPRPDLVIIDSLDGISNSAIRAAKGMAIYGYANPVAVLLIDGKGPPQGLVEVGRNIDVLTTSRLIKRDVVSIECLQRKGGPAFKPFEASLDWRTNRMRDLTF